METIFIILIAVGFLMFIGITVSGTANMLYKKILKENLNKTSNISHTAAELSKMELANNSISAQVVRVPGNDNACFDYQNKVIALSDNIHGSYSAVAQGIALHEVGHAIQDKTKSKKFATFKKFNLGSKILAPLFWISFITGLILLFTIDYNPLYAYIGFGVSAACLILETGFKFKTLSMEREASKFGEKILKENGISEEDYAIVKSIYNVALTTYFASIFKPVIDLFNGITWIIYNTLGRLFR